MQRTDVNPWDWSKVFGFSQAVALTGAERVLVCSGQTAIGPEGSPPTDPDMGAQVTTALANLGTVLEAAGMSFADVVKTTVYVTDVDAFVGAVSGDGPMAGNLAAMTLIGVARLAYPELKVEIEAIAAR